MTQLALLTDRGPLGLWLMFPKNTNHEAAAARFTEKHGHAPARVWQTETWVYAGPAPRKEIEKL